MDQVKKEKEPVKINASQVIRENMDKLDEIAVYATLPPEQQKVTRDIMSTIANQLEIADSPQILDGGIIKMKLMRGGEITIQQATGFNYMSATREMSAADEKAKDANQSVYLMVACSDIDGEPMAMSDMNDRLTVRDTLVLLDAFQAINLI